MAPYPPQVRSVRATSVSIMPYVTPSVKGKASYGIGWYDYCYHLQTPALTKNRWLILDAKKDPITQAPACGCPQS